MQDPSDRPEPTDEIVRLLIEIRDIARQQLELSRSSAASYQQLREVYTKTTRRVFRLIAFAVVMIALAVLLSVIAAALR